MILALFTLENTAKREGVGAAFRAFKTTDTTLVIRRLLRLDAVLTQLMAPFTMRALISIETQEERRSAIEQREDRTQGT